MNLVPIFALYNKAGAANHGSAQPEAMQSYSTPKDIIRRERMNKTFTKYHLGDGRVLHHFTAAHDELFHDHPWPFRTTILSGGYLEVIATPKDDGTLALTTHKRLPGTTHHVQAGTIHKLSGLLKGDCWTIIEPGQPERKSGFYKADEAGVWHRFWNQRKWRLLVGVPSPA
ncbi:hypothetical protein [Fibrella forsythiae]|uniref:Cupin n=1 Tax=Fibrella forsythiae TaxID=2817061 RepID=A0ABS3JSD8_9BACT|nr:hypothetical protein [Fibrella forsythiae]MBO0952915.1 hypothetical protein [Fibrella forsythiae]